MARLVSGSSSRFEARTPLKLVMTLLVRDEADVIRQNIDFHLARDIDQLVVVDNGSVDGTRDILAEYERLGAVRVVDEPGRNFSQGEWVTRAAMIARDDLRADWILNSDADEFWWCEGGQLKSQSASTNAQMIECKRRHMLCSHEDVGSAQGLDRLVFRVSSPIPCPSLANIYTDELPCPYFYLDLPSKVMVRGAGLRSVSQGNHSAVFYQRATTAVSDVTIYHFPVRSAAQFSRKVLQGGEAYRQNETLPETMGWHWRRWHRQTLENGATTALAEALPSTARLTQDLSQGLVVEDRTIQRLLEEC